MDVATAPVVTSAARLTVVIVEVVIATAAGTAAVWIAAATAVAVRELPQCSSLVSGVVRWF